MYACTHVNTHTHAGSAIIPNSSAMEVLAPEVPDWGGEGGLGSAYSSRPSSSSSSSSSRPGSSSKPSAQGLRLAGSSSSSSSALGICVS